MSTLQNAIPGSVSGLCKEVVPGSFQVQEHFYPAVRDAQLHPLVLDFLQLGNQEIVDRYAAQHPEVNSSKLHRILTHKVKHFFWAGSDIFKARDAQGQSRMIVIETNSCPSGQKSMPRAPGREEHGGFGVLLNHAFKPLVAPLDPSLGGLAVVFDKNQMEASGYAAAMADIMGEKVYLVEFYESDKNPPVKWVDEVMMVRDDDAGGVWHPIRACFRYVTQKPWDRLPVQSKTLVVNSTISCLAGGRNKAMAAQAFDIYNEGLRDERAGIQIRAPETIRDICKWKIPELIRSMGGLAVIKVPYFNAGQGVYTITNAGELDAFMATPHPYEKFLVQAMVSRPSWHDVSTGFSPRTRQFFHIGTVPDRENNSYVFDLRVMVAGSPSGSGFRPVAIYARRARKPLAEALSGAASSWEILGTNLSVKKRAANALGAAAWTTEAERLVPMDTESFGQLGLNMDDLIDAYIQTVLSVVAIDKMCERLMPNALPPLAATQASAPAAQHVVSRSPQARRGSSIITEAMRRFQRVFDADLFRSLVRDNVLMAEVMI